MNIEEAAMLTLISDIYENTKYRVYNEFYDVLEEIRKRIENFLRCYFLVVIISVLNIVCVTFLINSYHQKQ